MINGDLTGSRGRGRGNWNQSSNPPRELRRPHIANANDIADVVEDKPKSTLSAEAKEWFPPNYVPPPQQNYFPQHGTMVYHNNQSNYPHTDNSYYAGHGQGQGQGNYQRGSDQYHYRSPRYSTQDRPRHIPQHQPGEFQLQDSIAQLISVMCEVTFSPGRFAVLSGPLVDQFSETLDDLQQTQPLVDAIVNQNLVCSFLEYLISLADVLVHTAALMMTLQWNLERQPERSDVHGRISQKIFKLTQNDAIGEPNFRYNGARLCTMFDSVEPRPHAPSVFRPCLLERCAAEEAKIVAGGDSEDNICGFAMFLAELYMQLDDPQGGRIKALGESLCKVLKHLLTTPNNQSTKTVCQILKLSGLALDADCAPRVEELCGALLACERSGVQAFLVRNVLNLRRDRWGSARFAEMADSETVAPPQHVPVSAQGENGSARPPPAGGGAGGGIFYLPDGHNLTSEEAAFLQRHLPSTDQPLSDDEEEAPDDSDGEIWEPEMDAEQRADFLEFLKMSNQITR